MLFPLRSKKALLRWSAPCAGLSAAALLTGCASLRPAPGPKGGVIIRPQARLETQPVPHHDDAADDPAIWIHPTTPELSLILGTDKQGGLQVYDLDGSHRQTVSEESRPNNVDVLYGFKLGQTVVDLAVASTRGGKARGLKAWVIDPGTRRLSDMTADGVIPVLAGNEPYGCGTYQSARDGSAYAFVTAKDGAVEQWRLSEGEAGRVGGKKVRAWKLDSTVEGCVADDELGVVYLGEESRGVWKFAAEPDEGTKGELIARVGENGLRADVEGLALYCATGGRGYLLVSSQGDNTFKVYDRGAGNRFLLSIDPGPGKFGDVQDTDGIAVTSRPTSREFRLGMFIAQDGENAPARQNFKLFGWEDIAGTSLITDTRWSPRRGK